MQETQGCVSANRSSRKRKKDYFLGTVLSKRANRLPNPKATTMFKLFTTRRPRAFTWKPALDLRNPRIVAALTTFPSN